MHAEQIASASATMTDPDRAVLDAVSDPASREARAERDATIAIAPLHIRDFERRAL